MAMGEIVNVVSEVKKEALKEIAKETKERLNNLDKPLNTSEINKKTFVQDKLDSQMDKLDKPLNSKESIENKGISLESDVVKAEKPKNDVEKMKKLEPPITIEFSCPEGMDRKEFIRQLKAQERAINRQTVAENMDNRAAFEQRKRETGNGRDISEAKKAQDKAREKAVQSRIETNQKNGMLYSEAKAEAKEWIKKQAALHNPDQSVGGDPGKVSRMGDANVNSSIGAQWRTRREQLSQEVEKRTKNMTREELENTMMNVKLVVS